jgi:transposase
MAIRFYTSEYSFRIYMEQRVVIFLFTLKELKARAIQTELELVYGPEALARPTVKKWRRRSHQGRTDLFDDPRSGRPLMNDLAGAIGSMLEEKPFSLCKGLCHRFRIGKATCLRILQDKLGLTNSIFVGCCTPHQSTRGAKECHIRSSF